MFIAGSLSSIEEVREGEKDYAKRLDRHDVSLLTHTLIPNGENQL